MTNATDTMMHRERCAARHFRDANCLRSTSTGIGEFLGVDFIHARFAKSGDAPGHRAGHGRRTRHAPADFIRQAAKIIGER